jgi:hypothetical protein
MRAAVACAWLAIGAAVACASPKRAETRKDAMTTSPSPSPSCTRTVSPADAADWRALLDALPEGAVLCLKPGEYAGGLTVDKSVTLRALGAGVVIDAHGREPVVSVINDAAEVVIEGVTLRGGDGGALGGGGALSVTGAKRVVARDVVLEKSVSDANGGGAIFVRKGEVVVERARMTANRGARAQAVLVTGGSLVVRDAVVTGNQGRGPAALVEGWGSLTLERTAIVANDAAAVQALGKALTIDGCILGDPAVLTSPKAKTKITIAHSALSAAVAGAEDAGNNTVGPVKLEMPGFGPKKQ